jgi:hypothetical protein
MLLIIISLTHGMMLRMSQEQRTAASSLSKREKRQATVANMLARVGKTAITAEWSQDESEWVVTSSLPYGCRIMATVVDDIEEGVMVNRYLVVGVLEVNQNIQNAGVGGRLMRSVLALAKEQYGAAIAMTYATSPYVLRIMHRLFGSALIIRDEAITQTTDPLPITLTQAMQTYELLESIESNPAERVHGFTAEANLQATDMTTWERPQELNIPDLKAWRQDAQLQPKYVHLQPGLHLGRPTN